MKKTLLINVILFSTIASSENLILDGQVIQLDPSSTVSINSITGDVTASSAIGDLVCSQVGDPPILNMSAAPLTVDSGGSTQITYTILQDAQSCDKGGNWNGTLTAGNVTNATHQETITNITSDSTYTLRCDNNFGSSTTRSISVSVNTGNPNCTTQTPILSGNEDFSIIPDSSTLGNNQGTYDGLYSTIAPGEGWPGVYGTQSYFSLTKDQYAAMQFNTDNTNAQAKLVFTTPGNGQGSPSTATTISISECPGDFSVHLNQSRCLSIGGAVPNIRWSQNPNANAAIYCKLDKNKTYYFNIVHSNTFPNYTTSACTGSLYCGGIFSHTNEN